MSQPVIIAEKPSQAQEYASCFNYTKKEGYYDIFPNNIFPNGAKLTYGIGHLVTLKEPDEYEGKEDLKKWNIKDLPIIPEQYEFKIVKKTEKQFMNIKKLLKKATEIIIATDSDREGENIARLIIELSGANNIPIRRLWINSLEKDVIIQGFKNLQDGQDFLPKYYEAQARQIGDWLVGINATRYFTTSIQERGITDVFSVGRVQTPTLQLIYNRQLEIEQFKSEDFYTIESVFSYDSMDFKAKENGKYKSRDEIKYKLIESGINSSDIVSKVSDVKVNIKTKRPPLLYDLTSLQTWAGKKYKYSPTKVKEIVQELYDSPLKLVSYPRTDCKYITTSEYDYLRDNFESYKSIMGVNFEGANLTPNSRYVNNTKVQEHYALIPTKVIPTKKTLDNLSEEQANIYYELVRSVLAMFHSDFIIEETEIELITGNLLFSVKGKVIVSYGWKDLYNEEISDDVLPSVSIGDKIKGELSYKQGKTKPPKRFSESDLVNLMKYCGKYIDITDETDISILEKTEGLGTVATRDSIISNLINNKYIEIKKGKVFVTNKGELLCNMVKGTLLAKPEMTAKWETYLNNIGNGKGEKKTFIKNVSLFVEKLLSTSDFDNNAVAVSMTKVIEETYITKCPSCNRGHIIEKRGFYGCTEYGKGCKQTFSKEILTKSISHKNIIDLCTKGKTSRIQGFQGKKKFNAYLVYQDGKVIFKK